MKVNVTDLVIRLILTFVVFGVVLFLPAGTIDWPAAWVYLVLLFVFTIALTIWLSRFNPELLSERVSGLGRSGHKKWDKVFLALLLPTFFFWYVLMALDAVRFKWTAIPDWLQWNGAGVFLASFYIFYLTFRENTYLSPAVRIQTDRGQTVVSTGPYKYVRHPMYAGFILFTFGTALLLGSIYGLLGALLLNILITWRAVREEQVLKNELPGYGEYMTRVKHRFVPYVFCAGVVVLLLNFNALAQMRGPIPRASPSPPAFSDRSPELSKWSALLDKLAIEARELSDETVRPEALNSVADAYWEVSHDRSKELFSASLDLALSIENEKTRQAAVASVLSAAAWRDQQLAKTLTQVLLDKNKRNDAALKASLDLLDVDAKRSEAIALASSSHGATYDSAWFIHQLQKRDQEAADRVYSAYLNNENSRSLNRLLWLAGYPFGYGEGFGGAIDPLQFAGFSGFNFGGPRANRALAIAFLSIADQSVTSTLNLASSATPEEREALTSLAFFAVAYLLEEVEKYRPDLQARWVSLRNDMSQRINPNHRDAILDKLKTIFSDRDRARNITSGDEYFSEEVLQEAEKLASSCQRDAIYAKAVFHWSHRKDFKKALLVADKISAIGLRNDVIQYVYYEMTAAGTASDSTTSIDDALRYANRVDSPELRAILLVKLAALVLKNRDQAYAKQLLWDATKLAERVEQASVRAAVLLAIEKQFSETDTDNRFQLLKDAISAVNRSNAIRIDRLSVPRRVNFGCEQEKRVWYGTPIGGFSLIDSIRGFSQSHEDEALQLAMTLNPGVNRIKALASVAEAAVKRIMSERETLKKKRTAQQGTKPRSQLLRS